MQMNTTADPLDSCHWTVRRSTGFAPTPFTRASEEQRCNRPTAVIANSAAGVADWACSRHASRLRDMWADCAWVTVEAHVIGEEDR